MFSDLDIIRIEQEAREMRAREIQRYNGIVAARLKLLGRLALGTLAAALGTLAAALQPLFSWNPQDVVPSRAAAGPNLAEQANDALRKLFSWNPQAHHH